jgi:hypothetical protein
MSVEMQRILESKRAHRRRLAELPVEEKLRMLDFMRERELAIRGGCDRLDLAPGVIRETPGPYGELKVKNAK